MRFRVLDAETSQPIAGVKVRAWVATNLVTDDTGLCSFALPKPASGDFSYRITITKEGYVPKFITWAKSRQDKISDIPAEYTAKMDKAATIGGVIKDQDGQPVAGARILFSGMDSSGPLEREKTTLAPNYHAERADENGKWRCDLVPEIFENMVFRVDQPDFLPALFGCEGSDAGGEDVTRLPAADFLAGGAVMGIRRGLELSGIIVTTPANPSPAPPSPATTSGATAPPCCKPTTPENSRFPTCNPAASFSPSRRRVWSHRPSPSVSAIRQPRSGWR